MKIQGIKKVILVKNRSGADKLCINVDWPNPFPDSDTNDDASLVIDVAKDYGSKYAKLLGLTVDEIVTLGTHKSKFSS